MEAKFDCSKDDAFCGWTYEPQSGYLWEGQEVALIVESYEYVRFDEGTSHWDPSEWHRYMDEPLAESLQLRSKGA